MSNLTQECWSLADVLPRCPFDAEQFPRYVQSTNLADLLCFLLSDQQHEDRFSKPMLWIGNYIAVASLYCTLLMVADLFHNFRNRKLWFPCKYFTLNPVSLMVIAVAMKLSVDLTTPMTTPMERAVKRGSIVFMCTMMANLMPSLATMTNKELLANFIAMAILVITVAVNLCIQINTGITGGVSSRLYDYYYSTLLRGVENIMGWERIEETQTIVYVVVIFLLLVILMSSALAIATSKCLLESKYEAVQKRASNQQELQQRKEITTFEETKHHVSRYWVMATTGSPQFCMATSPTSSASGVICVFISAVHLLEVIAIIVTKEFVYFESPYKWSMSVIFVIQATGVASGTIASLFRCFAALSFELSRKWSSNHIKVFIVENYWTQKFYDWKQSPLPFPIADRRCRLFVQRIRNQILSCCIAIQTVTVVVCKTMGLIPIFLVIFFVYLRRIFFGEPIATSTLGHEQQNITEDLNCYALRLNDEVQIAERTLNGISNSLNRLIKKAEKQRPNNLLEFLERPIGFEGVEPLNSDCVWILLTDQEPQRCWSLQVVSLTSIAIATLDIPKKKVDSLLRSVNEGLVYAGLVEESLSAENDSVKFRKAVEKLWSGVDLNHIWLNNSLHGDDFNGKTSKETLELLRDRAKAIIDSPKKDEDRPIEVSFDRAANSMYCITKAVLQGMPEPISGQQLFMLLATMIADALGDCFTNLPQVIAKKCDASAIEKREESVKAAAELLGRTKEIIKLLQKSEPLSTDPDQNSLC